MKFFTILVLIILVSSCYSQDSLKYSLKSGSTIICITTRQNIFLASDSRQFSTDSTRKYAFSSVCKIKHTGNFFYGATGYTGTINPNIDILEEINSINLTEKTFLEKINEIKKQLYKPIYDIANSIFINERILFDSIINVNKNLIDIIFATFESDSPRVEVLHYTIELSNNSWVINCTHIAQTDIWSRIILGHKTAIDSILTLRPKYFNEFPSLKDALSNLIYEESKLTTTVSLPMDFLIITNKDYYWIQKQPTCN